MSQKLLFIPILLVFASCKNEAPKNLHTDEPLIVQESSSKEENKEINALLFINNYVENCNKMNQSVSILEWIESKTLTTSRFREELKRIIKESEKEDPEMGLGFDPIFDAQDYPEEGFELDLIGEGDFLTVRGKEWTEFKVVMKLVKEQEEWKIDGCGVINIPKDMQIKAD